MRIIINMKKIIFSILFLTSLIIIPPNLVKADELAEIEKQLKDLQKAYDLSVAATTPLESEVRKLSSQFNSLNLRIESAEKQMIDLSKSIQTREDELEYQTQLMESRVKSVYIKQQSWNDWLLYLGGNNNDLIRLVAYRKAAADQDRVLIAGTVEKIKKLAEDKKKLEDDKKRLSVIKQDVADKQKFLSNEIAKAKNYQKDLSGQIAQLSEKQKQLLAAKTGTFTTSVGDIPLLGDPRSRPDFDPGFRPAFGVFSFGAPHFKGMSQYGARGRARSGQNYEQILKAYYGDIRIETRPDLINTINTSVGSMSFEDRYLMGIAEMPSGWTENDSSALKAQAIAARTYALVHVGWRTNKPSASGSICITEQCQVYSASKANNVPEAWRNAVNATKGMVVISNQTGEIISTMYSASSGGYQLAYSSLGHNIPGIWDTKCGSQGCWTSEAYELIAESPWFYKGWYMNRSGKTCGRSHPWLSESEMADIVNSMLVVSRDGNAITHVSSTDNCLGSDSETWSIDRVRQEANKYGGAVSSISKVEVSYSTSGGTANVKFQTDKGELVFTGSHFRSVFNLRAPGVIYVPGQMFNLEKK